MQTGMFIQIFEFSKHIYVHTHAFIHIETNTYKTGIQF